MKQQTALSKLSNLFEKSGVSEANVIIAKESHSLKPNEHFGMIFPKVIRTLIREHKLSTGEIETLMTIFDLMSFDNLVCLTQATVAKELGIDKSTISRHFNKFYRIKILLKDESGSIWVNPAVFAKGKLWDFKNNTIIYREVELLAENLGLEEPPF